MDGRIPLLGLGSWPTPVEPITNLDFVDDGRLWVKREDLSSASYGGNKVRKLELLLPGSQSPILTFGPEGSHHVLSTAIHAGSIGRPCTAILVPQHLTEHHRMVNRLIEDRCARVIRVDQPLTAGRELLALGVSTIGSSGRGGICVIPPGGSSPRGILGCVGAGLELAAQVKNNECPEPKKIYVAFGTGGTAAGLALGVALGGLGTEVVAVTVASKFIGKEVFLRLLARRCLTYLARIGQRVVFPRLRLKVVPSFIGDGYARPTALALEAVELAAGAGIALETTYTGKAFAALLEDIRSGRESGPVMLLNTYGAIDHLQRPPLDPTEDASC